MLSEDSVREYAAKLASSAPAPGGGSAAALAGALGAALGEMVGNFTVGKEKFANVEEDVQRLLDVLEAQRNRLLDLTDEDAVVYEQVGRAYRMPRGADEEKTARRSAIQEALKAASEVPFGVCECCATVIGTLQELAEKGNPNLISDAGCAAKLALAALECGWLNVEINFASIKDEEFLARRRAELDEIIAPCADEVKRVWDRVVDAVCS